uniref:ObENOD40 protein n=2 Tax=Oryza TaxID=4527 RepID=Q9ZNT6_ORYBR|nr:OsENOD40 [Oryza sativa Japonica Group]BAA75499.1 ObENOD40 [Oryza brachyantha]
MEDEWLEHAHGS